MNCNAESVNIQPLIVSNIFEFDDQRINEKYQKVSLFELQVVLHNDLYNVMYSQLHSKLASHSSSDMQEVLHSTILQQHNQNHPQFKKKQAETKPKDSYNLWSNPDFCTPDDLIKAITSRVVWQGLDDMMEFKSGDRITIKGNT